MRSRKMAAVFLFGLTVAGCGPAEIVPMTAPGVAYKRPPVEGMDAEGETRNKAAIRPKETAKGTESAKANEPNSALKSVQPSVEPANKPK